VTVSSYVAERGGGPGGFLKLADSLEPRHKLNAFVCHKIRDKFQISLIISLANILSISSRKEEEGHEDLDCCCGEQPDLLPSCTYVRGIGA
jgi:hypothetical protein